MRKLLHLFLCAACAGFIGECGQLTGGSVENGNRDIRGYYTVSVDTLWTGSYLGIRVGNSSADCYRQIQKLFNEKILSSLLIAGNVFDDVRHIKPLIPLYMDVSFDDITGTSEGVQLGFKGDTVSIIVLNSGEQRFSWPDDKNPNSIKIGDSRSVVGEKLVLLDSNSAYPAAHARRFRLWEKDLSKAADSNMLSRPEWYFGRLVAHDSLIVSHLYFVTEKLYCIINEHMRD